eukprot:scaffold15161_cov171-Skeletonema_menzelii.AAC.1
MPTENKFEVVKGKSAALALSKGITTLSYHLCFPADTDDEYDFRTKNNQERLDGGERGKDDAESENNNHRSALLLRKEKLEAEMEIKRSLGQVKSSDQPTTKDFKTSSRSAADREDFAASVLVVDNDINKCGLNNRDVCKEIEVGHSLCQKKSSDQTPNITKDFKTSSGSANDAETDHETFAASLLPVDKDNDECRLNHREVGKEEPADKRLSELSRKRKQSSTEEEDCPPESDAQMELSKEECASSMGQRSNDAATKDAQIKLKMEECATGMGHRSNDAAKQDVQIKLSKEECASSMGQQSSDAAVQDVNDAVKGGVCWRHGEKVFVKGVQFDPK